MTFSPQNSFVNLSRTFASSGNRLVERAFSLVEMLVVLTVVGLLAAFAAPSLLTIQSTSLSAAGTEFGGFLNYCRSKAIAERTSVRVAIVTGGALNPDDAYRKYAGWEWDKRSEEYVQFSNWRFLPLNSIFENQAPDYVRNASYATEEKSAVEGDWVLNISGVFENRVKKETSQGETLELQFLTFAPSGRAYIKDGEKRNLIIVIRASSPSDPELVRNWYQYTIDTLTGRTRIYRP